MCRPRQLCGTPVGARLDFMHIALYTALLHPTEPYRVGFIAEIRALPGCFAYGETASDATAMAAEATAGYLNLLVSYGEPIPNDIELGKVPPECLTVRVAARFDARIMRWTAVSAQDSISA